tara:strand:- start:2551 stop:2835 length:285 start_codon:yes stop_codon:yes gene_type:complete
MPKSSKIKEHRTFNQRIYYKSSPITLNEMDYHYDCYAYAIQSQTDGEWNERMRILHRKYAMATTNFQKRRQNILKIRQKSLKTPHLGLKNLKKR